MVQIKTRDVLNQFPPIDFKKKFLTQESLKVNYLLNR